MSGVGPEQQLRESIQAAKDERLGDLPPLAVGDETPSDAKRVGRNVGVQSFVLGFFLNAAWGDNKNRRKKDIPG